MNETTQAEREGETMTKRQEIIERAAIGVSCADFAKGYMALDADLPELNHAGRTKFIDRMEECLTELTRRLGKEHEAYEQGLDDEAWIALVHDIIKEARRLA